MAKQIAGLCFLEGTFDDLTFYKMDGQYYARAKSSLSSQRVKTSPEFKWTMINARLLARASKIGSQVYKALPPGWRQFWMYRSFTGEAFTLLKKNTYTDEQVKQLLWKCYVEYWEQKKAANPDDTALAIIEQPKPKKIRKRRVYSLEALLRKRDKYGRPKYPELIRAEKERIDREAKEAWIKKLEEKKQRTHASTSTYSSPAINHIDTKEVYEILNAESGIFSTWQVINDGSLRIPKTHFKITQVITQKEPETQHSKPQTHHAVTHEALMAKT